VKDNGAPLSVAFSCAGWGTENISYIYSATGSKLAMVENNTVQSYYRETCVYRGNEVMNYILLPEGVMCTIGQGFNHEYFQKDYLGNIRAVVSPTATNSVHIDQTSDYYPFGMSISKNFTTTPTNTQKNVNLPSS